MKLAQFFMLSIAVHTTAVLVPIALNSRVTGHAITVTILPLESAIEQGGGPGGGRTAINQGASKRFPKTPSNERPGDSTPIPTTAIAQDKHPFAPLSTVPEAGITTSAEVSTDGIPTITGKSLTSGNGSDRSNFGPERIGGGIGIGSGNGAGYGNGQSGAVLTQARYRETPQPHYPESARREGKEGRVLLRVLVDEEGRTKAIEISTSSGYDLLDRAATEAIKKWRFDPARAGGKPIETWVKVPIEFQLSNAKP
jgi:TonB family protein